MWLLLFRFRF
uniref:Uncharacterized protein n=1 Tax=Arundo donax TaxID=35708 RepID=A0A0A8YY00_ARUDO